MSKPSDLNCGIKRWNIDAPSNSQYEECADGEWCKWDDVSAALMRMDGECRARVRGLEAESREAIVAANIAYDRLEQKLADANALLHETRDMLCEEGIAAALYRRIDAHLAAQPAAPKKGST